MDLLSLAAGCGLFLSALCKPMPEMPQGVEQWQPLIAEAAATFQAPEGWVKAVMAQESAGRATLDGRPITSKAGAMGLMQLMPQTYQDLRRQYGFGGDPYAPRDNILAGAAYLRQLYARYGYPGLFAAYNAGPGRFEAYLSGQMPLPDETITYLSGIVAGSETVFPSRQEPQRKSEKPTSEGSIFVTNAALNGLFVPLSGQHF